MSQKAAKSHGRLKRRNERWGYVFLLPWLLFFLVFMLYPFVYGIAISFTNFTAKGATFNGLANYKSILSDQAFWRSLWATVKYSIIAIPLSVVVALLVANALSTRGQFVNVFTKLVFYLPSVVCFSALVLVWKYVFSAQSGFLIWFFTKLGLPLAAPLDQPNTAILIMAIMVATVNFGQSIILYSAAINGIPASFHEAAMLDGATPIQRFFKITLPLLHSQTVFITITTTIAILQLFVIPYMMTNGAPQYRTSTVLLMIYNSAFQNGQYGYASAVGIIFFLLTSVIAAIQFRITRRDTLEY